MQPGLLIVVTVDIGGGRDVVDVAATVEINTGCSTAYSPEVGLGRMVGVEEAGEVEIDVTEMEEAVSAALAEMYSRGESIGPRNVLGDDDNAQDGKQVLATRGKGSDSLRTTTPLQQSCAIVTRKCLTIRQMSQTSNEAMKNEEAMKHGRKSTMLPRFHLLSTTNTASTTCTHERVTKLEQGCVDQASHMTNLKPLWRTTRIHCANELEPHCVGEG